MLRRTFISNFSATALLLKPIVIKMPALSPTMEKGTLVAWESKIGDKIEENSLLAKVQTDKATNDFNYVGDECFLARIVAEAGSSIQVGDPVALAVEDKDDLNSDEVKNWVPPQGSKKTSGQKEAFKPPTPSSSPSSDAAPAAASSSSSGGGLKKNSSRSASAGGDRVFASPAARKAAQEIGVSLSGMIGSGGSVGRITKNDVVAQAKMGVAGAKNFEDIEVTPMRAIIAQRLTQSKNIEVPHYYLMNDYRADSMLKVLKHFNDKADGKYKISVNDFILKCVARANLLVPECNTHWHGDYMRRYNSVDVSVAVATPTGLITPIIRNAHIKGLVQISNETKELAKRAREGTLTSEEYQGGTVSVSNLGAMSVDRFTAIINPPQSMILAVGQTRPEPEYKKNEDGTFTATGVIETKVSFSASFDHRVVDGAIGAKWFKHFGEAFENPLSLLL